jgi:hypothetical protein
MTLMMFVVFLGLTAVEPIHRIESGEPAWPMSQTEPEARSQITLLEPASLVRRYGTAQAAYCRLLGQLI